MAFARLRDLHPLHGSCVTHEIGWRLNCAEFEQLREAAGWVCQLCGNIGRGLVTDHDYAVGKHAIRGTLCVRCNGNYMDRVDSGEYPIDPVTLTYIQNPWHLARRGLTLAHNPVVRVAVDDLTARDRAELDRLNLYPGSPFTSAVRDRQPNFEHAGLAACVAAGDLRPVMRLIRMAHIWKRFDIDIAALGTDVPGGHAADLLKAERVQRRPGGMAPDLKEFAA